VVVVGRSILVGLPLFHLLLNRNATITLCHSHTHNLNLNQLTREADIVISAVGKPNLITQLKPNGISIDIGICRDEKGKLCGDILEEAKRESYLGTPVPGGVGPLTVAMLMENTVKLWRKQMRLLR
jgi:methylenetetrahydrofolate dehydrogenase (NADP+) / methenyltetrahydrofolate cyclohydrolase